MLRFMILSTFMAVVTCGRHLRMNDTDTPWGCQQGNQAWQICLIDNFNLSTWYCCRSASGQSSCAFTFWGSVDADENAPATPLYANLILSNDAPGMAKIELDLNYGGSDINDDPANAVYLTSLVNDLYPPVTNNYRASLSYITYAESGQGNIDFWYDFVFICNP